MMKIIKRVLFLLLLSLFSFNLTFAQQKVDTVFVGKATSKTIKQSIDKKALVYIIVRHGEKEKIILRVEEKNIVDKTKEIIIIEIKKEVIINGIKITKNSIKEEV